MVAVGDQSNLKRIHIDCGSLSGLPCTRATKPLLNLELVRGQGVVSFCIVRFFSLSKVAFETSFATCSSSFLYLPDRIFLRNGANISTMN